MTNELLKPKLDLVFKKLFSDEKNKDLLQDFMAHMLDVPLEEITEISVKNPELSSEDIGSKQIRLDLNLEMGDKNINVEMQVNNLTAYKDRALYYGAMLLRSGSQSGEVYSKIRESIAINIVTPNIFDCESYQSTFKMIEENRHEVLSDKLMIRFIELKKLAEKNINKANKKELWLHFLNAETKEEFSMIEQMHEPIINKACNIIYDMSEDTRVKEEARMREKFLMDVRSLKAEGLEEGLKLGEERGIKLGEERGIKLGEERGIKLGEERGIKLGEERGIKLGEQRGIKRGEERGIKLGKVEVFYSLGMSEEQILEMMRKDDPSFNRDTLSSIKIELKK